MQTIAEKTLFLYTVLNKNLDHICERDENKKTVRVYCWKFNFQTLTYIHNFCNTNAAYYELSTPNTSVNQEQKYPLICITITFI